MIDARVSWIRPTNLKPSVNQLPDTDCPVLATPRLLLSPFVLVDAPRLLEIFQDPAVRKYLLDDRLVDKDWVAAEIQSSEQRFNQGSAGIWSIRIKPGDGQPILGFVGFRPFFDPPQLQLLYGLLPTVWGKGFATEASRAVIHYGFTELNFRTVVAATDTPNQASIEVMRRLGMEFDHMSPEDDDDESEASTGLQNTVYYRLTRQSPLSRT